MDNSAVSKDNLCKSFQGIAIVDRVSLKIERGELFGLLGTNSAGNSTIIKMLATMLRPSTGFASIMGRNFAQDKDAVRSCIDVIFRDSTLDGRLTGRENQNVYAQQHNMDRDLRRKRIDKVLDLIDMHESEGLMSEWQHRRRPS